MKPRLVAFLLHAFLAHAVAGCANSGYAVETNYLSLGGDNLYYETTGEGFPLVLAGGGSGMDLSQWERVVPELARKYRVISFDPRGIGRSDNPTVPYSDADDLATLLDQLELDRVGLIGLSSSGGLVLDFASRYPERVSGVLAVAPFVPGFEFSQAMLTRLDLFNRAAEIGKEAFLDTMFDDPHFMPSPLDSSVRSDARNNLALNFEKGSGFDPSLPIQFEPPLIERLGEIVSPVLLLVGELDHPEVKRRNMFLVKEISAAKENIVNQAGHNSPLENPKEFLYISRPFLEQIAQEAATGRR